MQPIHPGRGATQPWTRRRPHDPPPPGEAHERRHLHAAIAIVLVAGAVRMGLAAGSPLVPDEAYYWEWSRRLAPGYFDHPPAIALLVAAGTAIFGATPLGVRFWSVIAGVVTILLLVDIARRHGGGRAALYTAAASACVPLASVGLVLATPDAPLLLAWAAGMWTVDRALAAPPGSRASFGWWAAAGVATGVGLLAKYTAVLFPLGVTIAFAARRGLRPRFRTPEPYLAAAIALAVFLPVVAWNAAHGWASFAFQLSHGLGRVGGGAVSRVGEMLGGQLGLVSPILFVLLAAAVVRAARGAADDRRFVLAAVALTTFGFFLQSALGKRVEPNWPAAAYLPGFVLLGIAGARSVQRRWLHAGLGVGAAMVLVIYAQTIHPVLPIDTRKDPTARGHGWDMLADGVSRAAPTAGYGSGTWLSTNRYQDAAQLAFLLPGHPEIFSLNLERRPNQYDFWPRFPQRARPGDDLVYVSEISEVADGIARGLGAHFAETRRAGDVQMRRGDGVIGHRRIWIFRDWKGSWPDAKTPG